MDIAVGKFAAAMDIGKVAVAFDLGRVGVSTDVVKVVVNIGRYGGKGAAESGSNGAFG